MARAIWSGFSPDELDALRPESTRTIDVSDFVDLADIDPIFYNRTYWLAPATDEARGAYALLRDAMEDQQRVGIPKKRAAKTKAKELALARQIIESLAAPWKPERYHDTYTEQLRRLVTSKSKKGGDAVVGNDKPAAGAQVVDLMEALEASVKRAKGARSRKRKSA